MSAQSIAILGPGAIGGFLASLLWRAGHNVTCIAKPEMTLRIQENGLVFISHTFESFTARPRAVEKLDINPDIIFVTTKAIGFESALERITDESAVDSVIIPLLNGIEHMGVLRKRFGDRIIAGTIGIEVRQSDSGEIIHLTTHARITLAADSAKLSQKIPHIIAFLTTAGIDARTGESEAQILWEKLVRLNALACMTTVTNKPIGEIRSDATLRRDLEALVREASEVAVREGATISAETVIAELDALEPTQFSSMQRDRIAEKILEIDAIAGAIVRAGARQGVLCPTIAAYIKKLT